MEQNAQQYRRFERTDILHEALPTSSGSFEKDFNSVLSWCLSEPRVTDDPRPRLNMPPEPYRYQSPDPERDEPTTTELLEHARSVVGEHLESWQWLYERMADEDSRVTLLIVVAYRTIGWKYVPMQLDTNSFWGRLNELGRIEENSRNRKGETHAPSGIRLIEFDREATGVDVELFSDAFGVFNEFNYSQYVYRGNGFSVGPEKGDRVIDCGACFGGTSLFLADQVGAEGRVMSFEFVPGNLEVFNLNVGKNKKLEERITLVKAPVWSVSGKAMGIVGSGPAAQVSFIDEPVPQPPQNQETQPEGGDRRRRKAATDNSRVCVWTRTIDDEVAAQKWQRVDMIKMDIEGAEMSALLGAEGAIRAYRPKMAVCVYHRLFDFYELAQFLDRLDLGYRFYMQHATIHGDETVLFAVSDA